MLECPPAHDDSENMENESDFIKSTMLLKAGKRTFFDNVNILCVIFISHLYDIAIFVNGALCLTDCVVAFNNPPFICGIYAHP